jgi:hypothetical protein
MKLQLRNIIGDWKDTEAGETNFSKFYHSKHKCKYSEAL